MAAKPSPVFCTHAVRNPVPCLVEDVVYDFDYLAGVAVHQKCVVVVAHPYRSSGRDRQTIEPIVDEPVVARPEERRKNIAERPVIDIPSAGPQVGADAIPPLCSVGIAIPVAILQATVALLDVPRSGPGAIIIRSTVSLDRRIIPATHLVGRLMLRPPTLALANLNRRS